MEGSSGLNDAILEQALAFIAHHPRCSVRDLQGVLVCEAGTAWRVVHELENRRQVRVDDTPAGWQFTVPS